MLILKWLLMISASKATSHPKPMSILMAMLFTSWFMSIEMSNKNSSPWPSILMIMSINGGLMILYIFVIAMFQQNKKTNKTFTPMMLLFLVNLILYQSTTSKKNSFSIESIMSSNYNSIIVMTIIMMISMTIMMKMSLNPFKTMKSSS